MKKTFATALLAMIAVTAFAAVQPSVPVDTTTHGCMPGNGGSHPICTPGTGPGGK